MSKASWSQRAKEDAEEIYEWIARRDGRRQTAKVVMRAIRQQCYDLADIFSAGSTIGTARPDLGEHYRAFTHMRWVIIFRPSRDGIDVMRVVDGSRDFPQLFDD